jgi:hypothetical protein
VHLYSAVYKNLGFGTNYRNIRDNPEFLSGLEGRSYARQEKIRDIEEYLHMPFTAPVSNDNPYYDNSLIVTKHIPQNPNDAHSQNDPNAILDPPAPISQPSSSKNLDTNEPASNSDLDFASDRDPEAELQEMKKKMQKVYIDDLREQMELRKKRETDDKERERIEDERFESKLKMELANMDLAQEVQDTDISAPEDRLQLVKRKIKVQGMLDETLSRRYHGGYGTEDGDIYGTQDSGNMPVCQMRDIQ